MIEVVLKAINKESGFCIDNNFVESVKQKVRSKKKKEVLDELLCAQIIAQFLANFEDKNLSREVTCH